MIQAVNSQESLSLHYGTLIGDVETKISLEVYIYERSCSSNLVTSDILVKRRRAIEKIKEAEEINIMYGRDYYQDTQIVDKNDYYRKE